MIEKKLNAPVYTISMAAKLMEISVHTLRMYEREGLIIPFKKKSNQRLYSELDLYRVQCIRRSISNDKMSIEGMRRVLALIPCWGIVKCSHSDRAACEAYKGHTKPCWMINHKDNICEGKNCRECIVYNAFGNCESIKNKLKELIL